MADALLWRCVGYRRLGRLIAKTQALGWARLSGGFVTAILVGLALSACNNDSAGSTAAGRTVDSNTNNAGSSAANPQSNPTQSDQPIRLPRPGTGRPSIGAPIIEMGTGEFIGAPTPSVGAGPLPIVAGPDIQLDFSNVEIRDVIRSIFGEVLKLTYSIDPGVQGAITLQTGRPVPRASIIPLLETTLQRSGVGLIRRGDAIQVVPIADAARGLRLGSMGRAGTGSHVLTPQFIAAADLQRVLEPLLPPGASVRAEPARNAVIITGTEQDIGTILANAAIFDVDYLKGMSVALLPLENARARDVAREVTTLLSASGGNLAGVVRVMPLERLNAVLISSLQPTYMGRVQGWVRRLDRGVGATEQKMHVYMVQNGRAGPIAGMLQRLLGISGRGGDNSSGSTNGQGGSQTGADDTGGQAGLGAGRGGFGGGRVPNILLGGAAGGASGQPAGSNQPLRTGQDIGQDTAPAGSEGDGAMPGVRITADEANNALVILANAQDYAVIEAALRKLDIKPLQVMIEATVAEVTLNDKLNLGLQYYLKSGNFQAVLSESAKNNINIPFPGFNFIPGFNFAFSTLGGSQVLLDALKTLTQVRVLSSPTLMVLNNQTGRLQVGDQVPVAVQSAVGVIAPGSPVVNSIEYRDTGVILRVTPRVNASGIVLLDISEEVSEVGKTTSSTLDSPTISQRRLLSSVLVTDGETIALGGLIRDTRSTGRSGIPGLVDVPVLGYLFGTNSVSTTRTELIILITPKVIRSREDGSAVTNELLQKVPLISQFPPQPRR